MPSTIRVLVVDDSAFMRHVVSRLLSQDPTIDVVGTAPDGRIALEKVRELSPDVITLDVEMPHMDGLAALGRLMEERPTPVVMLSAYTQEGAYSAIRALELGALDVVAKPSGPNSPNIHRVADVLLQKVKEAALVDVSLLRHSLASKGRSWAAGCWHLPAPAGELPYMVVAIGSSTGGPRALHMLVRDLPANLPAAVVIAQHMSCGFTTSLAARLDELSPAKVKEAEAEDKVEPGAVLIAPGDCDVQIDGEGRVRILRGPEERRARPSVDIMFESVAAAYGPRSIGVVLTGMGSDGANGARCIRSAGGAILAEDRSTCIVYGMPRQVIEDGSADMVLPIHEIPRAIVEVVTRQMTAGMIAGARPVAVQSFRR